MQLSALSLAITRLGRVPAYSPLALFTGTTTGAWYDPSDINLTWRRNLLTYSEQFDNAGWPKINSSVISNSITTPDGTLTAAKLVENATTQSHGIDAPGTTINSGTTYTASLYAKLGERRYLFVAMNYGQFVSGNGVCFDLQTGEIVATGTGSATAGTITPCGNGWYRCSITLTAISSGTAAAQPAIYLSDAVSAAIRIYTGDGTSGIYIWGAQLEQGSTATPYQRITDGIQDYLQYQAQPVLYRDAAGTLPVTAVEQPVGLMLDKSKGLVLGPELVTNEDFSGGATGWSAGTNWTISGGFASHATGADGYLIQTLSGKVVVGKTYKITSVFTGPAPILAGGNLTASNTTLVNGSLYVIASGTSLAIYSNANCSIDSISVRELPGNHAFNASGNSANFPVLSARYNLLTKTEDFSDAAWAFANVGTGTGTKTANYGIAPDGTQTAARVQLSVGVLTDRAYFYQGIAAPASATQRWYIKTNDGSTKTITMAGVGTKQIIVTGSWQLFTSSDSAVAGANPGLILGNSTPTDLSADLLVWHPDVRVSNDALNQPTYQRVNTATDYDTVGFKPYLRFNGTNQWLQTNSIDFTYGDKMFVSAGVRKLSDAATGIVAELSADWNSNSGSFVFTYPRSAVLNEPLFGSRATSSSLAASSVNIYPAPITNILSGIGNISGDQAILRVNGAQAAISTADQGTGNYGNYPLYIGARAGSSLWFNGRLYGLIVAGKLANAVEITETEKYVNGKTAAY